ncbi:MAG: hypothetical protein EAZ62_02890 [Sphingobacteriia bacterium]|nr:MAG: hypothetical protein EAZ62_02890 [Sphingobacteriia bacterium]
MRPLLLLLFCFPFWARAQSAAPDTGAANSKKLDILFTERYNIERTDSAQQFISLAGKVKVKQGKTIFYADSAVLNRLENSLEAFGNVHINDADSIHTYAQYLKYLGKEKRAFLKNKVRLTDGKGILTTEALEYDVSIKLGIYLQGGKLVNKKSVLTSQEGYYYGETKDVVFKRKVVLQDPETNMKADTLQYNTATEWVTFSSPTTVYFPKDKRTIRTREGYYDQKLKKGELYKRSVIEDSVSTFTADEMAFDDSTGLGAFRGNAVYRGKDSTEGFDLVANDIKTNKKTNSLVATQQPLLLIKQGRDSIYVTADTLYSAKLSDLQKKRRVPWVRDALPPSLVKAKAGEDSTDKFFEAYFNVRVFSDSLQAVGDSMFYGLQDSVFRLFKNPVIWAANNQINGDTVYLFLRNKKMESLKVFENALAVSKVEGTDYLNQLKGTSLLANFLDGELQYMRVKGSAENVYYAQDEEKKLVGVSKSTADLIHVFFKDNKAQKVRFENNFVGDSYPIRQVNHESLRLRNAQWNEAMRPKSKFDILAH